MNRLSINRASSMLGHSHLCGPLCLPRNYLLPAARLGRMVGCALAVMLACLTLLANAATTYGQRVPFQKDTIQNESIPDESAQPPDFNRLELAFESRWLTGSELIKKQPHSPLDRRGLLPLSQSKHRSTVAHPRLAEAIKSRELLFFPKGHWWAIAFQHHCAGLLRSSDQLSDHLFSDVPHSTFKNVDSLPVAVRHSQGDQQLFFYFANASPWRMQVHLRFAEEISKQTIDNIKSLLRTKLKFVSNLDDTKALTVVLDPYEISGGSVEALGPIKSYTFEYLNDVASELRKRVFGLQVKLQQAQRAKPLRSLSNPEFLVGQLATGAIEGWEIGQQPASRFRCLNELRPVTDSANKNPSHAQESLVDPSVVRQSTKTNAKSMKSYLQINSLAEETTWIRSQPVTPTETGRLSVSVWLRISLKKGEVNGTRDPPDIRIAIDGRTPTSDYYRFGVVGKEPTGSLVSPRDTWKRFVVHFEDLPINLTDLRIGFDTVGEGTVDIGQVELFDRWFDDSDAKTITQLLASADAMLQHPEQFDRCRRLLEEPWAMFLDDHFPLKPMQKNTPQPVPMFRPKVAQALSSNQKTDKPTKIDSKAGQALNR